MVGAASERRQDCSDEETMCDYERQRAERIARNEQILQEMGIVCSMDAFSAAGRKLNAANRKRNTANNKSRSPSRKSERLCAPTRTSLRIQGQSPEVQAVLLLEPRRPMCSTNGQNSSAQAQGGGGLDEHNLHRINTMSEAALQRRIYKIQRCDKLQSFVEILRMKGLTELADEALEALQSLRRHST